MANGDDGDLYGFDGASVDAIADVVRRVLGSTEVGRRRYPRAAGPVVNNSPLEFVKFTSTTKSGNFYPGTVYLYNAATDGLDQPGAAGGIWIRLLNGIATCPPDTTNYWAARRCGANPADGKTIFVTVDTR